jgi:hypothetical protein
VKRVAPNIHVGYRLLNFWHMTRDAFVALAARFVMRMLFYGWRVRAIWRRRAVTIQAENVGWLPQECIVFRTMRIVATETCDTASVHEACHEVVALHAIFVASSIREMSKGRLPELVVFQLPEIVQSFAHVEADRPVIGFTWTGRHCLRPPLRVALDARVGCVHVVEAARIHNIRRRWLLHVVAAWSMTLFTADVPLGHFLCVHIVIDGVTAIASRSGGPLQVVGRI